MDGLPCLFVHVVQIVVGRDGVIIIQSVIAVALFKHTELNVKVSELIDTLKSMNPDHIVVVSGYEGGVNEITNVEQVMLTLDVNSAWYYGAHEIDNSGDTPAVVIA